MAERGDKKFCVWPGAFSGKWWAGWMRFDGERWVAIGVKHDITDFIDEIVVSGIGRAALGEDGNQK